MATVQTLDPPRERMGWPEFHRADAGPEDALIDRVAFAMATERNERGGPELVERLRLEAAAALSTHAFCYLHNQIEDVRRQAVAEHLGGLRAPPGFPRLVAANLVALAIAGLVTLWVARNTALLDRVGAAVTTFVAG